MSKGTKAIKVTQIPKLWWHDT